MKSIIRTLELKRSYSLLEKIEFALSSIVFLTGFFSILAEEPTEHGSIGNIYYLYDLAILGSFYFSFLLLNFVVIPNLRNRQALWINISIIVAIIAISVWIFPDLEVNVLLFALSSYFLVKFGLIFLLKRFRVFREEKGSFSTGIVLGFLFYLLLMFLLILGESDYEVIIIPGVLIPYSIGIYSLSFLKFLPAAVEKKRPFLNYLWKVFLVLLLSSLPIGILIYALTGDEDLPAIIAILNFPVQLFLTLPLSWFIYRRYRSSKEQVHNLKKELGHSTAKFDFLRSQINPHFLFNALNTLYGTAIQEKAERTGEGIQQLGDMMRFMLHENMQEKISLSREIEYLENYVQLQRLRTDVNPNIVIQTQIQQNFDFARISPMLLIPFVENAFKHGISFREASHIKIALEKKGNTLYFDVYNSKHLRQENDPEKDKSGIGLNNVKQRLQLLYPQKHELLIRENSKEFFVHLSLELE